MSIAAILAILKLPPVMAFIQYGVIEVVKRAIERVYVKIPNRWIPAFSAGLGGAIGALPVFNDPLTGLVVGAASSAIHDILNPRPDAPKIV